MIPYQTHTIRSGHWQVEIAPAYGANPVSLRYRGTDVLVPWSEETKDPFLVGAPLLLPANRTAGGCFRFRGQEYSLPVNELLSGCHLHGNLYRQEFTVLEQKSDRICLSYVNMGEIYPFPFQIRVCYRVSPEGFFSNYEIENLSDKEMPLVFGLHITFREPDRFQVPLASCQERDGRNIPTGRYIPLSLQEERYCTGSPSKNLTISGYYLAAGDTARIGGALCYKVTGFDHWILYNGQGKGGFLCIEPQLGGVNGLNDPSHCPVIPPKSKLHLQTRLYAS